MSENRQEAINRLRPAVAFYAGFFPRYNRLMVESGFPQAAQTIRAAWLKGDHANAAKLVPSELVQVGVARTPTECRERLEADRHSGLGLPIIFPVGEGANAQHTVMDTIRACAP